MVDVNLPEHRGTVIGVSRLFRAVGNAISVGLTGVLITALTPNFPSPNNYALSLAIMMFFVVPAIFCYWRVSRKRLKWIIRPFRKPSNNAHINLTLRRPSRRGRPLCLPNFFNDYHLRAHTWVCPHEMLITESWLLISDQWLNRDQLNR